MAGRRRKLDDIDLFIRNKDIRLVLGVFKRICLIVLERSQNGFAMSYAETGITNPRCHSLEGMQAQALYILANLGAWRGDEARKTKAWLKGFTRIDISRNGATVAPTKRVRGRSGIAPPSS